MTLICPHCRNDDPKLLEFTKFIRGAWLYNCTVCSRDFEVNIEESRKGGNDSKTTEKKLSGDSTSRRT